MDVAEVASRVAEGSGEVREGGEETPFVEEGGEEEDEWWAKVGGEGVGVESEDWGEEGVPAVGLREREEERDASGSVWDATRKRDETSERQTGTDPKVVDTLKPPQVEKSATF